MSKNSLMRNGAWLPLGHDLHKSVGGSIISVHQRFCTKMPGELRRENLQHLKRDGPNGQCRTDGLPFGLSTTAATATMVAMQRAVVTATSM